MKKTLFLVFLTTLLLFACRLDGPPPVMTGVSFATLGDSLTMGTQDAGLSREMQLNCYPYRIAQQMGLSGFEQPYVDRPSASPPTRRLSPTTARPSPFLTNTCRI